MYPLTICSILVVAIAIERYSCYRKAQSNMPKLLAVLREKLTKADISVAVSSCEAISGTAAEIIVAALKRLSKEQAGLESFLEGEAAFAAAVLRKRLDYLDTIVTLAPLLGLLGTVIGMISTFNVINIKAGQTQAITGGVGEALVATAFGLCVAIMALGVHSYFKHWLDGIITEVEQASNFLLNNAPKVISDETA